MIKSLGSRLIRFASFAIPAGLLLRIGLMIRRVRHTLEKSGRFAVFCRGADYLIYSFRSAPVARTITLGEHQGDLSVLTNDPLHYDLVLGLHEPKVSDWMRKKILPGMTVLDIGANIGYHTIFAAFLTGHSGRVLAVEADSRIAKIVDENVKRNSLKNIVVVAGAASGRDGTIRFGQARTSGWSGLYCPDPVDWIEVQTFTIDSLVDKLRIEKVDFIKIDVEGAEKEVLAGMQGLLRRQRPALLIEVHGSESQDGRACLCNLLPGDYELSVLDLSEGSSHIAAFPPPRQEIWVQPA